MNSLLKLDLQRFADGENAGGAVVTADAGSASPEQTSASNQPEGVTAQPQRESGRRDNIFPRVAKVDVQPVRPTAKKAVPMPTPAAQQPAVTQPQQPAAETWADVKKRFANEYGADVRAAVNERFKNHEAADKRLNDAVETLAEIAPFYGLNADDPATMDIGKIRDAIRNDRRWYEQSAMEKGVPVETEMHLRQLEREKAMRDAEARRSLEQETLRKHLEGLRQQEAELKKEFPDFDLMGEIQTNQAFARMTAPNGGFSVRQAYFALHGDELMQQQSARTAQVTQKNMSRAIQSGAMRPQENGMAATGGGVPALDPSSMTREQWREFRRRAQRGEKIAIG